LPVEGFHGSGGEFSSGSQRRRSTPAIVLAVGGSKEC
jgi:hypothetical protein